jgi:hypothetical protein
MAAATVVVEVTTAVTAEGTGVLGATVPTITASMVADVLVAALVVDVAALAVEVTTLYVLWLLF